MTESGTPETTHAAEEREARAIRFADLTTLRVGGPVARLVTATTPDELVELVHEAEASGEPWMVLGGGSNVLVGDDGFDGTVIRIATRGIDVRPGDEDGTVHLRVQAGENWDELVAFTVERGFAGLEALAGIPGSVGASPVQNIGAYGQELSSALLGIEFLGEGESEPRVMSADELELGYRTSVLKQGLRGVVVSVDLVLHDTTAEREVLGEALGTPVAYAQLANALGVQLGDRVPLARVREAVLALRAGKGMVLDPDDVDSVSAGSFFTNPIVPERVARTLPGDAPRWYVEPEEPDEVTPLAELAAESPLDAFLAHQAELEQVEEHASDGASTPPLVKLSAAWLIERSGIHRGFALPGSRAGISTKHTLALTNRGGASAEEVAQLARFVQQRVQAEFGIVLHPEPTVVGVEL
ncbi:UDP-N-acetylmuramate dehydrogenase [Agromyces flavus]|uniref:UDP-N-acetylenolpyruvoylglucosamine reductase n=1 Tax=Agromyces flavus TaxID=589382 RepID=A0A1H1XHI5_9MICO|nr:UDP-N-acetylmuramate dehydrogenase [Agromyces flavus]MCP2366406.1 UDP-N-acetylmuramate dehydrogenase [Agromyces flavus]GGI44614.1 UDP-N-acetylenolpyruvoylglucosamine reductase [Agromyces flavus]SDT08156.1 UDP-N-acetylmuramate dehydrogenase [Agromyces flavus]